MVDERCLDELAGELLLHGSLRLLTAWGYRHHVHWQQGEFHHDHVFVAERDGAPLGPVVVVATNCNGGVKEVLCMPAPPDRWGLWAYRVPGNPEFDPTRVPEVTREVHTVHWFDPAELLVDDARSELRPEFRRRQRGGGWVPVGSDEP